MAPQSASAKAAQVPLGKSLLRLVVHLADQFPGEINRVEVLALRELRPRTSARNQPASHSIRPLGWATAHGAAFRSAKTAASPTRWF